MPKIYERPIYKGDDPEPDATPPKASLLDRMDKWTPSYIFKRLREKPGEILRGKARAERFGEEIKSIIEGKDGVFSDTKGDGKRLGDDIWKLAEKLDSLYEGVDEQERIEQARAAELAALTGKGDKAARGYIDLKHLEDLDAIFMKVRRSDFKQYYSLPMPMEFKNKPTDTASLEALVAGIRRVPRNKLPEGDWNFINKMELGMDRELNRRAFKEVVRVMKKFPQNDFSAEQRSLGIARPDEYIITKQEAKVALEVINQVKPGLDIYDEDKEKLEWAEKILKQVKEDPTHVAAQHAKRSQDEGMKAAPEPKSIGWTSGQEAGRPHADVTVEPEDVSDVYMQFSPADSSHALPRADDRSLPPVPGAIPLPPSSIESEISRDQE